MPVEEAHASPAAAACAELGVDAACGLGSEEVAGRRATYGANAIPERRPPGRLALARRQVESPLVALLAVAAALSLAIGEPLDAVVIAAIVVANAIFGYVQEGRAEDAARAVRELLSPQAQVVRDGRRATADASDLVVGDLVVLPTGARVPADGRLVEATRLAIDQSALTGESVAQSKRVDPPDPVESLPADRQTMAFAGSTVARGSGRMIVTAVGASTEIGKIATAAEDVKKLPTPLQRRVAGLGAWLLRVAIAISVAVTVIGVAWGDDARESVLAGISLAVAAIPEGLPAVLTIALALGMRRLADRGAIVRRLSAVETLGSTTVICADKTGTLTENRMRVTRMWPDDDPDALLTAALLACEAAVSGLDGASADPTEGAIMGLAADRGISFDGALGRSHVQRVEPFDSERKRMSVIVADDRAATAYVKGAPDVLAPLLRAGADREGPARVAADWGAEGVRVLLVARRDGWSEGEDPESDLTFVGLIGITDPPRPGVAESVADARAAGVRTAMITGDHPATAVSISRAVGIAPREGPVACLSGSDIEALGERELAERAKEVDVYARVLPQHKLRLVRALQDRGEVVAMTGDGVNDVPALRAAHIGVSMGMRGTDAAAGASEMVLADDDYSTIVRAIRSGRTIYDNVLSFVLFLLSANAGEVIVFLAAVSLGLSAPLTVIQILTVNLLTDGLPALALSGDRAAPGIMRRPPRPVEEGLLDTLWPRLVVGGLAVGVASFCAFLIGDAQSHALGQTMAFVTLVFSQMLYVFSVRTPGPFFRSRPGGVLVGAVGVSIALQVAIMAVPALAERWQVVPMSAAQIGICIALSAIPLAVAEAFKAILRRSTSRPRATSRDPRSRGFARRD